MRLMDFRGCVTTSHAFDEDRMVDVTRQSNFTRDMVSSGRSISNRTDAT